MIRSFYINNAGSTPQAIGSLIRIGPVRGIDTSPPPIVDP